MKLKNVIWMLWFVLKKKWIWALGVLLSMYVVLIPYQKNLLLFFGNPETAKPLFWESAYLFQHVFALVFLFQAAVQLLNTETPELHIMWRKQICFVLGAAFLAWQFLAIPGYVWYVSVYPSAIGKLFLLIFTQFVSASVFYVVSAVSRKTIAGFVVVLVAILFLF